MLEIVVPYRRRAAKSRIALPEDAREALAEAMLTDVLEACSAVAPVRIADGDGQAAAVEAVLPADGVVLVVNADLPCATEADVRLLVAAVPERGLALVEAMDGTTNALALSSPALFRPLYGPGSAARFSALGAVAAAIPNLRDDVDTLDDLERLNGRLGRHTRAALAAVRAAAR
jgi:2-phospho-L-lactate guanylyltransferase (CobY/MobA/RfbA family)